jgi:hypothetical protein
VFWTWCETTWRPSNSTNLVALDSDYALGVLCSDVHIAWGLERSSTMRTDPRYTPTSAFDTFPWPDATTEQRQRIADLGGSYSTCVGHCAASITSS